MWCSVKNCLSNEDGYCIDSSYISIDENGECDRINISVIKDIELPLNCPFCGGKAEIHNPYGNAYFVKCSKCRINQDKRYHQRCDAVKAWNKRVKDDRT